MENKSSTQVLENHVIGGPLDSGRHRKYAAAVQSHEIRTFGRAR